MLQLFLQQSSHQGWTSPLSRTEFKNSWTFPSCHLPWYFTCAFIVFHLWSVQCNSLLFVFMWVWFAIARPKLLVFILISVRLWVTEVMCCQRYSYYKKCSKDTLLLCFAYKFIYFVCSVYMYHMHIFQRLFSFSNRPSENRLWCWLCRVVCCACCKMYLKLIIICWFVRLSFLHIHMDILFFLTV